jgi:hypothetical protein
MAIQNARIIVVATVLHVYQQNSSHTSLRTDLLLKGKLPAHFTVRVRPASWRMEFAKGKRYILFLQPHSGIYLTNPCSASAPFSTSYLRQIEAKLSVTAPRQVSVTAYGVRLAMTIDQVRYHVGETGKAHLTLFNGSAKPIAYTIGCAGAVPPSLQVVVLATGAILWHWQPPPGPHCLAISISQLAPGQSLSLNASFQVPASGSLDVIGLALMDTPIFRSLEPYSRGNGLVTPAIAIVANT